MKTIIYSLSCLILFFSPLAADTNNSALSVLVIGGGPAGLASSIEARLSGAEVVVVEKRPAYIRNPSIFLLEEAIALLEQWKVSIPEMNALGDYGERIGFVQINALETGLQKRAHELGVRTILGEFCKTEGNSQANIITPNNEILQLSYDLLVAADGTHSKVRECTEIPLKFFGTSKGIIALMETERYDVSIPDGIRVDDTYLRKIAIPNASLIFMQRLANTPNANLTIPIDDLIHAIAHCGWLEEAKQVQDGNSDLLEDITSSFQQAERFVDVDKNIILLGDSAATASFYTGIGANTALKSAAISGFLFRDLISGNPAAYQEYNERIDNATNFMIDENRFLFTEDR
ncbi:FAD-dependent monooxygenase [Simkania negevensis]|uniref:FAD-dependent monooxygenase n=1 Tax=Simkania negevensis TaxID=83561 RepID=A0ABS3AQJ2_9BACT|nr:FAD-dependent monooxygenase [Simkania negevensis]